VARTFYRFVETDPPTARDFASNFLLGRPRRPQAGETEDEWRGLSVFDSPDAARAMLRRVPRFRRRLLAQLELPDDAPVRIAKTFGPGHYTLWGDPQRLRDAVVAVTRVEG
jgi:hypothetical protein